MYIIGVLSTILYFISAISCLLILVNRYKELNETDTLEKVLTFVIPFIPVINTVIVVDEIL